MIRICIWAVLLLAPAGAASAQTKPIDVTTDTLDYCQHLAGLFAQHRRPSPEARRMAEEGSELCAQGAIRPGIARLRRALMLMRVQHRTVAGPH